MDIGVGIIGAGAMGKIHADNLRKIRGVKISAIADIDKERAIKIANGEETKIYTDYRDLINDSHVDAIIIATPTIAKPAIVKAAASAKKPIFCEKPIALTLEDALKMKEIINSNKVPFQVGFQRRFDPSYVEAKHKIEDGSIGKIILIKENNRDPPDPTFTSVSPTISGGIFIDTAIHDFDTVRWISGSKVVQIYAEAEALVYPNLKKEGDYDTVMAIMKLENGSLAYIDALHHTVYGFDARLEVVGTEGAIFVDMGESSFMHLLKASAMKLEDRFKNYKERWREAYLREIEYFIESIINNKEIKPDIDDGIEALKIAIAAKESSKLKTPITIP